MAFAERAFRLKQFAVDQAFDDDFGVGRNHEIDADRAHDANRRAGQSAGNRHLVLIDRKLLRSGKQHDRRAADDDGAGHRFFALLILAPMQIAAGAAGTRRHAHAQPVGRLQRGAVGAHVLHAGFGIAGNAERGGEIGRGIETGRRHRHRQPGKAVAGSAKRVTLDDDLLTDG